MEKTKETTYPIFEHRHGLTRAAAAARLGITPATLRAWRHDPPVGAVEAAEYLLAADVGAVDTRRPSAADVEAARRSVGLTQAAAADVLGVAVGAWSTWASGETAMPWWRWVAFGLLVRRAVIPAAGLGVPTAATAREVRLISGVTLAEAAAMVRLPNAVNWELFERPDMSVPIPAYLWELFVLRVARGSAAPVVADIRAWREARGLSQEAAAALVYVTRATWANWETGRTTPPAARLDLFALKS